MSFAIKTVFQHARGLEDTRRIQVEGDKPFVQLLAFLKNVYAEKMVANTSFTVKYFDEENELITVSSDAEMSDAINICKQSNKTALKVFVSLETSPMQPLPSSDPSAELNGSSPITSSSSLLPPGFVMTEGKYYPKPSQTESDSSEQSQESKTPSQSNKQLVVQQQSQSDLQSKSDSINPPETQAQAQTQESVECCSQCCTIDPSPSDSNSNVDEKKTQETVSVTKSKSPAKNVTTVHSTVICDICRKTPIIGFRYKCLECPDFDLCEKCESENQHMDHPFLKLREYPFVPPEIPAVSEAQNQSIQQQEKPRSNSTEKKNPKFNCICMQDITIPEGHIVTCGTRIKKIWKIHNCGTSRWPDGTNLKYVGGELHINYCSAEIPLVDPDKCGDISCEVIVPKSPGNYKGFYHLSTADGQPFGNRLWIDVHAIDSSAQDVEDISVDKPLPSTKYSDGLKHLRGMGFVDDQMSSYLLAHFRGDVQKVVNWFITNS